MMSFIPLSFCHCTGKKVINSQFVYAPLIWMFAGKSSINKICKIHFKPLQVVYKVYDKLFLHLVMMYLCTKNTFTFWLLPLFIRGKLETSEIDCVDKV